MALWLFRWQLSSAFDSKVYSSNDICQCAHITPVYRRVICKCMDEIWTKGCLVIVKTPACDTQGSMWYDKVYAHWKVIRLLQCMLGQIKDRSGMVRYYAPLRHFVLWVLLPIQIICHIRWITFRFDKRLIPALCADLLLFHFGVACFRSAINIVNKGCRVEFGLAVPRWISNRIPSNASHEITYPFQNFNR